MIKVRGPFWVAKADVIECDDSGLDEQEQRILYTDDASTNPPVRLALFRCRVKEVEINFNKPGENVQQLKAKWEWETGYHPIASLLLSPLAEDEFRLRAGELDLRAGKNHKDQFNQMILVLNRFNAPTLDDPRRLIAHAEGLWIDAIPTLPWTKFDMHLPFHVSIAEPASSSKPMSIQISLDKERLLAAAGFEEAIELLEESWEEFEKSVQGTAWVSLLRQSGALPDMNWTFPVTNPPQTFTDVKIDNAFAIRLQDQPATSTLRPKSVAQCSVSLLIKSITDGYKISVALGSKKTVGTPICTWKWETEKETFEMHNINLHYDPFLIAEFLRNQRFLPDPEHFPHSENVPTSVHEPAVLWGSMPISDGWCQIPFYNLTAQLYISEKFAATELPPNKSEFFMGAFVLTNDPTREGATGEHPWSVSIFDVKGVEGTWNVANKKLGDMTLTMWDPSAALDGLFWLGTEGPTVEDALPRTENWLNSHTSMLLTTPEQTSIFPPATAVVLRNWSAQRTDSHGYAAPLWNESEFYWQSSELYKKIKGRKALPPAIIWHRERGRNIPLVQTMPLTQNQDPPIFPSESRALLPFEQKDFEWATKKLGPFGMRAMQFATIEVTELQPWSEWWRNDRLRLASLALPGLALSPVKNDVVIGYFAELPVLDENNALAQIPPIEEIKKNIVEKEKQQTPPLPMEVDSLGRHWQILQRKSLYAEIESEQLIKIQAEGNPTKLENVIEPLTLPLTRAEWNHAQYPDTLTLEGIVLTNNILTTEKALRGIDGTIEGHSVVAGSMAAAVKQGDSLIHDQRGLSRGATKKQHDLLEVELKFEKDTNTTDQIWLVTTGTSLQLTVAEYTWDLWFRLLPFVATSETAQVFNAPAEKSNDPGSFLRDKNFRKGFAWGFKTDDLKLAGLDFHPLRIQRVSIENGKINEIEIAGKLQLPLFGKHTASEDHSNAVLVIFKGSPLTLYHLRPYSYEEEPEDCNGVWILPAEVDLPYAQLRWEKIRWDRNEKTLILGSVNLVCSWHGIPMSFPLEEISFSPYEEDVTASWSKIADEDFDIIGASVTLRRKNKVHEVNLTFFAKWQDALTAKVSVRPLRKYASVEDADQLISVNIFNDDQDLNSTPVKPSFELHRDSITLSWHYIPKNKNTLIPSIPLASGRNFPFLSVLTFKHTGASEANPTFKIRTAWLEILLDTNDGLHCAYSLDYNEETEWRSRVYWSGTLEVQNLISWPIQKITPMDEIFQHNLEPFNLNQHSYLRHTVRILWNQTESTEWEVATSGKPNLFILKSSSWNFPALVEHRIVAIQPGNFEGHSLKWTSMQHVSLATSDELKKELKKGDSYKLPFGPQKGGLLKNVAAGIFRDPFRSLLLAFLGNDGDSIWISCSGTHLLRTIEAGTSVPSSILTLSTGTVRATLNQEEDFHAQAQDNNNEESARWRLLHLPFLGHLALKSYDPIEAVKTNASKPNQATDPRWLDFYFTNWLPANVSGELSIAPIDSVNGTLFRRLPHGDLKRNWELLQSVKPTVESAGLLPASISPREGASRLSRAEVLLELQKEAKPWLDPRPALFLQQAYFGRSAVSNPLMNGYAFFHSGVHLLSDYDHLFKQSRIFPAATLLPYWPPTPNAVNLPPLVAVSPYQLILPAPNLPTLESITETENNPFVAVELVAEGMHHNDVASREQNKLENYRIIKSIFSGLGKRKDNWRDWASNIHRTHCPDSPVAFLRITTIILDHTTFDPAKVRIHVEYDICKLPPPFVDLPTEGRSLRSLAPRWVGRDGQLALEPSRNHDAVGALGLAPPQVNSVHANYPENQKPGAAPVGSQLEISVVLADKPSTGAAKLKPSNAWWNALSLLLPFKAGRDNTQALPEGFRSDPITTFLPDLPCTRLPELQSMFDGSIMIQPLLPGAFRYRWSAARPGAPFIIRASLETQSTSGQPISSGSIPVQHRFPRPVPLPKNLSLKENRQNALQSWADYFHPEKTCAVSTKSFGDAFFSPPNEISIRYDLDTNAINPMDFDFKFDAIVTFPSNNAPPKYFVNGFLIGPEGSWELKPSLSANKLSLFIENAPQDLKVAMRTAAHGEQWKIRLAVGLGANPGQIGLLRPFAQMVELPFRIRRPGLSEPFLEPRFIAFEDPEYNRRLATPVNSSYTKLEETNKNFAVAIDRMQYNPNSELCFRAYLFTMTETGRRSFPDSFQGENPVSVKFSRIRNSIETTIFEDSLSAEQANRAHLMNLNGFLPGDSLSIVAFLNNGTPHPVTVRAPVVAKPMIESTESAYALLRCSKPGSVVCARFAWSPSATRLEMTNEDDLKGVLVSRRAVFYWTDTVRNQEDPAYAIQKIMPNGSTHFPQQFEKPANQPE